MEARLEAAADKLTSDAFTIEMMCFRSEGLAHLFERVGTYDLDTNEMCIDPEHAQAWREWESRHIVRRHSEETLH